MMNKSFDDCKSDPAGIVYADWEEGQFRCLVLRGPASLCAYVGVNKINPLYGKHYDDVNVSCHGGMTFSAEGDGKPWQRGYW